MNGKWKGLGSPSTEYRQILQRPEETAVEDWLEIDPLLGAVSECHRERIRPDDAEPRHPMDGMGHRLLEWFDLDGRLTGLQEVPVLLQFRSMDFRPCLNESLLRLWQAAAKALDGVDSENGGVFLVVRGSVPDGAARRLRRTFE